MQKKIFFEKISGDVFLILIGILMFILVKIGAKTWNYSFIKIILIILVTLYIFGHVQNFIKKSITLEGVIIENKAKVYLLIAFWAARLFFVYEIFYIF